MIDELLEHARHQAILNKPLKDGRTQRVHLEGAANRGSVSAIAQLEKTKVPDAISYLWDWFLELHGARRSGVNGLEPISYSDIDAWSRLTHRHPTPDEVASLLRIDSAYRNPEPQSNAYGA